MNHSCGPGGPSHPEDPTPALETHVQPSTWVPNPVGYCSEVVAGSGTRGPRGFWFRGAWPFAAQAGQFCLCQRNGTSIQPHTPAKLLWLPRLYLYHSVTQAALLIGVSISTSRSDSPRGERVGWIKT